MDKAQEFLVTVSEYRAPRKVAQKYADVLESEAHRIARAKDTMDVGSELESILNELNKILRKKINQLVAEL